MLHFCMRRDFEQEYQKKLARKSTAQTNAARHELESPPSYFHYQPSFFTFQPNSGVSCITPCGCFFTLDQPRENAIVKDAICPTCRISLADYTAENRVLPFFNYVDKALIIEFITEAPESCNISFITENSIKKTPLELAVLLNDIQFLKDLLRIVGTKFEYPLSLVQLAKSRMEEEIYCFILSGYVQSEKEKYPTNEILSHLKIKPNDCNENIIKIDENIRITPLQLGILLNDIHFIKKLFNDNANFSLETILYLLIRIATKGIYLAIFSHFLDSKKKIDPSTKKIILSNDFIRSPYFFDLFPQCIAALRPFKISYISNPIFSSMILEMQDPLGWFRENEALFSWIEQRNFIASNIDFISQSIEKITTQLNPQKKTSEAKKEALHKLLATIVFKWPTALLPDILSHSKFLIETQILNTEDPEILKKLLRKRDDTEESSEELELQPSDHAQKIDYEAIALASDYDYQAEQAPDHILAARKIHRIEIICQADEKTIDFYKIHDGENITTYCLRILKKIEERPAVNEEQFRGKNCQRQTMAKSFITHMETNFSSKTSPAEIQAYLEKELRKIDAKCFIFVNKTIEESREIATYLSDCALALEHCLQNIRPLNITKSPLIQQKQSPFGMRR